jgi:hypothetical protein
MFIITKKKIIELQQEFEQYCKYELGSSLDEKDLFSLFLAGMLHQNDECLTELKTTLERLLLIPEDKIKEQIKLLLKAAKETKAPEMGP